MFRCKKCGSTDVRHEITFMFDPNSDIDWEHVIEGNYDHSDFEYCVDCEDETKTEEIT